MLNIQLCQKMLMHMLENFFGDRKLEIEYLLVQTWDNIICPLIWDSALSHCWVTYWDLNSILLFKLLHFYFEWIVFCDLVSCKDSFILHKSDFSCLIRQCWNIISGTTMWPQAIGTTSHPNFGMYTGSQGPNPAIFSQNCPNRAMLPGQLF